MRVGCLFEVLYLCAYFAYALCSIYRQKMLVTFQKFKPLPSWNELLLGKFFKKKVRCYLKFDKSIF